MGLLARLRPRRASAGDDAAPPVALEEVRRRLELLLAAVYGRPITVATAEAPHAPGALRRLLGRIPDHLATTDALPASDGERVLLPATLPGGGDALARYRLMAVQQAERLARGTVTALPPGEPPLVRDLYLLAESAAVEAAVARATPGLAGAQAAERAAALARRPPMDALTPAEREVETLVRRVLSAAPGASPDLPASADPASADPAASLAWARATAARLAAGGGRYRGVTPVAAWGAVLPATAAALAAAAALQLPQGGVMRAERGFWGNDSKRGGVGGSTGYNPDATPAVTEGEDDDPDSPDVSDPSGSSVAPGSGNDTPIDSASAPGTYDPALQGAAPRTNGSDGGIVYPEWDCEAGSYRRPGARVRIAATAPGDGDWARHVLQAHGAVVRRLREEFERLRARRLRLTQQRDGEELDLAACVRALVDLRTGHAVSDRLYAAVRPARRELSILLLVDISGSTSELVSGGRIIDVEKVALLLASEAFDALGDRYAILTFSGRTAQQVRMRVVKDFGERNGDEVRGRVAALQPEGYTRMGAAIRHASALLARQGARHRLLLILSDGKPNDDDQYIGHYAIEDTRQAVAEARAAGIFPFCLTVDVKAAGYLPRIFGVTGHMILHHPEHLPLALLKVVRGLLRG
jgi:nitric oxide reductase NorD protein